MEESSTSGPSLMALQRHPLLVELANKTGDILNVFSKLPSDIQMDGLDMLQNVVNAVMQKITEGRVTAVKFVPVEGLAVTASLANAIKEEPIWMEETNSITTSGQVSQLYFEKLPENQKKDVNSKKEKQTKTIPQTKKTKCTKKVKVNNSQGSKQSGGRACNNDPNKNDKKLKNNEAESFTLNPKKRKKKVEKTESESNKKHSNEKSRKVEKKLKIALKLTKSKKMSINLKSSNISDKAFEISSVAKKETEEAIEEIKESTNKIEGDEDLPFGKASNDDQSDNVSEESTIDSCSTGILTPPKTPCKPEVIALLKPKMRLQPPDKRKRRKPREGPGKYQCSSCSYSSDKKFHYEAHLIVHTGEKRFCCEKCDKVFTAQSSLKRHLMAHEGVKPHQCPICGRTFIDLSALRIHSVVHTGEAGHECPICFKEFVDIAALFEHEIQHEGERLYKCEKCDKMYTNSANLSRHRRVHTGEMPYSCKVEGCDARFRDLSSLKLHNLKHTGEKPYTCEFCEMKFKTSSDYLRHKRSHTNERNYECQLCFKKFIQGWHLKQHQRMHADHRPWVCELCDKKFRSKASLAHHTKWHRGIKEYQCHTCDKKFSTKKYLESHQVIHTNDKPYKCKTCGSRFNQISNLKRHERIHSDVKQYKCHFCPKAFKYINSWRYHEGTHKGNMFTCEKCGLSFKSPQGIKAHATQCCSIPEKSTGSMDFESFIQDSKQEAGDVDNGDVTEAKESYNEKKDDNSPKLQSLKTSSGRLSKRKLSDKTNNKTSEKLLSNEEPEMNKRKQSAPKKTMRKNNSIKQKKVTKEINKNIGSFPIEQATRQGEELDLYKISSEEKESQAVDNSIVVMNNDTNESIIVKAELDDESQDNHKAPFENQLTNGTAGSSSKQNCKQAKNSLINVDSIHENSILNGNISPAEVILTNSQTSNLSDSQKNIFEFNDTSIVLKDCTAVTGEDRMSMDDIKESGDDVAIMKDAYVSGKNNSSSNLHVTNVFSVFAGQ